MRVQFSEVLELHLGAFVNVCALLTPVTGTQGNTSLFQKVVLASFWLRHSMLQGRLQIYPSSLAVYPSFEREVGWKGSVCAAVLAVVCCEVLCVVSVLSSAEAQDGQRGCARSCVWAGRSSGAPCQQHCPKAAWQQSREAGQALDVLQGLLSLAWSLHLASWHLRCARAALQRLCPVPAGPVTGLGGHWESSLQQGQSLSCSPTTATATGTEF